MGGRKLGLGGVSEGFLGKGGLKAISQIYFTPFLIVSEGFLGKGGLKVVN